MTEAAVRPWKALFAALGLLLAAGLPAAAADLRFASLLPAGGEGEWIAVVEGKSAKGRDGVVVRAGEEVLAADWQPADGGRQRAVLRVPPGAERLTLGPAGGKKGRPEASVRIAPLRGGFGDWTIYHVMLGMFANGSPGNDGEIDGWRHVNYSGGDLQGVREKADYIAGLGATAVWLSPLFQSATSHGYDVRNYYRIGDAVGVPDDAEASLELFRGVRRELQERGVRVILDLPLNHASRAYDRAAGDPAGHKPRATAARQEAEKVWESWGAGFRYWSFDHQPTRRFLKDVALHWLVDEGVDGLRLDYVRGVPRDFWAELHAEVAERKPGAFLVGECWIDAGGAEQNAAEIATYYEPVDGGAQFDSLLDFPMQITATNVFARGGSAEALEGLLQHLEVVYGAGAQPTYFLDNHDLARFLAWTDDPRRLTAAIGFLASLSSPMVVFYGTETGLSHGAPKSGFTDASRVPMPWDALDRPLAEGLSRFLVARREHRSLTHGARLPLSVDRDVLVMAKVADGETALVGVNLSSEERLVELEAGGLLAPDGAWQTLGDGPVPGAADGVLSWRLPPLTTSIAFHAADG